MEKPIKLGPTQLVKVILSTLVIQNSMCAVTEGNCDNEFKLLANSDQNKNNGGNLKYLRSQVPSDIQQETAQMAMKRILGPISHKISLKIDPSLTTSEYRDSFLVSYDELSGLILITGTTGVASLYGLNDFLRNHCSCLVVWEGAQLSLPDPLPQVVYQKIIVDRFRYYQNVCTDSYSFVWWDWDRWEKEIDWMALHGINMPLAFTGQEEIWRRVYTKIGLSQADISEYITGPAFLAWWRMGNIQKWGGPILNTFLQRKLDLLHKIISRMRNMGMIPVLPAFAGNVPLSIQKIFPNASLIEHKHWNSFNKSYSTFMLTPTDPLFTKIGQNFLHELTTEIGTNHIYSCDTFNENDPQGNSSDFLRNAAKATYAAMTIVDPKAVWMMQSWVFHSSFWTNELVESYLSGVDLGNALILDLEAERRPLYSKFNNFYGHAFIWCMLQNFGGTSNIYGALDLVNNGISFARGNVTADKLVGIGSCPEGINQNSVMFEFLHEASLQLGQVNVTNWIYKYSDQRYAVTNDYLYKAWKRLRDGPYNAPQAYDNHGYSVVTKRPSLKLSKQLWYNPEDMQKVLEYFLTALNSSSALKDSELYKHDLVDFTRQFLNILVTFNYRGLVNSYQKQRLEKFTHYATAILDIFNDLQTILQTSKNFLLGIWVKASETWSDNAKDKLELRYNALNQITLWGPSGEISDYAAKQWAGSVEHYYKPRWHSFINALNASMHSGIPFNSKKFKKNVMKNVEIPFTLSNYSFPSTPTGDSLLEAKRIYGKWNIVFSQLNTKMRRRRKHQNR